jgi:hypothetical protein
MPADIVAAANWNPYRDPVNTFHIGNPLQPSPGIATVIGAGSPRSWDERKGYGLIGATLWYTGRKLSKFKVRIELRTEADWDAWVEWRKLLKAPSYGRRAGWLPCYHPLLAPLEIDRVVVLDRPQENQDDEGVWTCEVEFQVYRRPRLSLAKPTSPNGAGKQMDEKDWDIAAVQSQIAAERAGLPDPPQIGGRLVPKSFAP